MWKKSDLERIFKIIRWDPTQEQITLINAEIERRLSLHQSCAGVIELFVENVLFISTEGIDNSDLNLLLSMVAKK